MKIDSFYQASQAQHVMPPQIAASLDIAKNDVYTDKSSSKELFQIKDTYEPAREQVRVNFGGYDKNGRGGIGKLSAMNSATPINNDFSTEKVTQKNNYIMEGLSSVLGTDQSGAAQRMRETGIQVEDLVNPDRAKNLSEDPKTQTALQDFATTERSSLLKQSGMSDAELTNFVAAVTKTTE